MLGHTLVVSLMTVYQESSESSFEELYLHELCTSIVLSIATAVRFHDVAQPVSAGHKCSGKCGVHNEAFLCARHLRHHHILAECVRRECLDVPLPFFALPFTLCPPCFVVSVQVSGDVLSSVQERCPQAVYSQFVRQDLCSNLCSTPVIAIAIVPSDPVNGGSQARTPHGQSLNVLQVFKRPFLCWSYTCWCNAPAGFLQPRGAARRLNLTGNGIMACHRCAVRVNNSVVESCSTILRNGSVAAWSTSCSRVCVLLHAP